jgi:hypothetical protein
MSTLRRLSVWVERIKIWEDAEEQDIAKLCQTIDAGIAALQELILLLAYRLEGIDVAGGGDGESDSRAED